MLLKAHLKKSLLPQQIDEYRQVRISYKRNVKYCNKCIIHIPHVHVITEILLKQAFKFLHNTGLSSVAQMIAAKEGSSKSRGG